MNVSMIMAVGAFAFLMTIVGLVLTIYEFRNTVYPQPVRARVVRPPS